jgi:hypothetical protein
MSFDIFLSHSSSDKSFTRQFVSELRGQGYSVFFDEDSIKAGQRWEDAIRNALSSSKSFVTVLDPASVSSKWSAFEIGAALSGGLPVVPVVAPGVSPEVLPDPIRHVTHVRLATPSTTANDVVRLIKEWRSGSGLTTG